MSIFLKIVAALLVAIAAFLVYAVVHAFASPGGANVPVCVGYIAGAAVLGALAVTAWRRPARRAG